MIRIPGIARLTTLVVLALLLSACGRWAKDNKLETLPVDQLYSEAKKALVKGNVNRAQRYYQRLIARFPYGPYTEQAQVELAYAYYKGNKPEDATAAINRFVRTYPAHAQTDYMYYLRGLINFDRDTSAMMRLARLDQTQRDQNTLTTSFNDFNELIQRYPNSRYSADARIKMAHLRNQMARHELNVAVFYLERRAWVAAANRGSHILEQYPQSIYQGDALAVMSEAYVRLDQNDLAADARRVLELNYPNHPYLRGKWPAKRSWWKKLSPIGAQNRDYHGDDPSAVLPPRDMD